MLRLGPQVESQEHLLVISLPKISSLVRLMMTVIMIVIFGDGGGDYGNGGGGGGGGNGGDEDVDDDLEATQLLGAPIEVGWSPKVRQPLPD